MIDAERWNGWAWDLDDSYPESDQRIISEWGFKRATRYAARYMDESGWPAAIAYADAGREAE